MSLRGESQICRSNPKIQKIDCHDFANAKSRNDEVECDKSHNDSIRFTPKFYFILGIIFNLCLLGFFKYTDFLLENFNTFSKLTHLDFDIPLPHILLPLALSFVTFQQIAFLFDCYKRTKGELNENLHIDFVDYALFISFFPQLIAGPIVHHREMMPQFAKMGANSACGDFSRSASAHFVNGRQSPISSFASHNHENSHTILEFASCNGIVESSEKNTESRGEIKSKNISKVFASFCFCKKKSPLYSQDSNPPREADSQNLGIESTTNINYEYLAKGIFIFSIGLFKKVFIADSFAKWANAGFSVVEKGGFLNTLESWATSLSYTFQLYFDFSGYCDMAMGLALMFGIMLPLNFDSPYKSLNIAEFWRRWHITLGRFLRECLYIPLGGNRVSKILNLRNLFIVAFLSGIWHGAGWGFVIWGVLHGIAMVIHRIYAWILERLVKSTTLCHTERSKVSLQITQSRDSSLTSFAQNDKVKKTQNDNKMLFSSNEKNQKFLRFTQTRLYKLLCWFITFNFVNIAWIFFRSENLNGALNLIKGMFGVANVEIPHKWSKIFSTLQAGTNEILIWLACAFIVCLMCKNSVELMQNFTSNAIKFSISLRIKNRKFYIKCGGVFMKFIITLGLFFGGIWILCKNLLADNAYSPFVYFNF